jgi:DNA invertase Pin-like site-specific DNA recombinase
VQMRELKEFVERRGWQLAGECVELGISSSKVRRPELERLMADARRHQFDAVIVWKFDRFAQSVSDLEPADCITSISNEAGKHKIQPQMSKS